MRAFFSKNFFLKERKIGIRGSSRGGEQQRVAIARALIMDPKFLFADEPTGNLDSVNGMTVMKLLKKINDEKKTTIVMVTHEPEFAKQAHRMVQLADGKIISDKEQ